MSARAATAVLVLAAAAACWIDERPFAPVLCGPGRSCPAFYTCVDVPEGEPICQAAYPAGRPDGAVSPPGPYRDYCRDVWPLFEAHCVECHGPDQQLGVIRFRLDLYESDAGFLGARVMAPLIRHETFVYRTMPPQNATSFPEAAERIVIAQWVDAGAPYCGEDAGTSDGGDGG